MSDVATNINWYPGHMAKAIRLMQEQLSLVDIVIEIKDSRIPIASSNPIIADIAKNKPVLVILNKADLADEKQNELWSKQYEHCLITNSVNQNLSKIVVDEVKDILKDKLEKAKAKGIRKKVLRAMVVGIPNVGKSTFINNVVKKKITKTENRPGVTRNLQWIKINEDLELLDTPGVLWPKLDNQDDARLLALLGSIKDDLLDKEDLVRFGLNYIVDNYPGLINKRYDVEENKDELVDLIALKKNCILKDNNIDYNKTYDMILKDIRNNKIGRITYQYVDE